MHVLSERSQSEKIQTVGFQLEVSVGCRFVGLKFIQFGGPL